MKPKRIITALLLAAGLVLPLSMQAQKSRHTTRTKTTRSTRVAPAQPAAPNVSGQPAYLTPPVINQAPASPNTADPQIPVNVKPQRKVRVVPAPPPPGPIAPAIPPKE